MPGAPNRPLPIDAASAAAPPGEEAGRAVLRRIAPMKVALLLDQWKGAPSRELTAPYERAEAAFAAGDWSGAQSHLDQLSVRFAEPRWPTLPPPFRDLRVAIPPPQPPHWDADHALSPAEKEQKRLRREADRQLSLARGTVGWMKVKGLPMDDLEPIVANAERELAASGLTPALWDALDRLWAAVRARLPSLPTEGGRATPPPTGSA